MKVSQTAVAIRDGYPVSPGHSLIVTRRHVGSWFETTEAEKHDILHLLTEVKRTIDVEHQPDGYNVGINDGPAAGQTIAHLHVHIIPRYLGDLPDPRGGVRWVIPELADYWTKKG